MFTDHESCERCDFVCATTSRDVALERIARAIDQFKEVIEGAGGLGLVRPTPDRWSIVEYAGHLRDALLSMRERIILASILETPTGTPIFRDERITLGFSRLDTSSEVAGELTMAGGLFVKTVLSLDESFESRTLLYSPLDHAPTTIGWVIAQGAHECVHHLSDVVENLDLLGGNARS